MSALSTSSCDSSLCETPQTTHSTSFDFSPRPGHSRAVSFDSECIIIPECDDKVKRKISIPTLTRQSSVSSTSSTSGLKSLFRPKIRRRASDQGVAPLRSCLAHVNSHAGPSTPTRPVHTNRRASSSAISPLKTHTQPLSPCCQSCLESSEKGLSPGWEIQFSGGARARMGSAGSGRGLGPASPTSPCDTALARNVKVVDEVECKRAVVAIAAGEESPGASPCPKWRNRLCPLSRSAGAGMPATESGCSKTLEEEQGGEDKDKCEAALKRACTGIWITSRPGSASPSPSRTLTPVSSSTHLPSITSAGASGTSSSGSGTSTPTRPALVIRTSSSHSLERARESCMAVHSDRVLRSASAMETPSPPASIKGLLVREAESVSVHGKPASTPPSSLGSLGKKQKAGSRWLSFGSGVKIGV